VAGDVAADGRLDLKPRAKMKQTVRVVCATRAARDQFFATTALGRSWTSFGSSLDCELLVYPSNTAGLPTVYNHAIEAALAQPAILVFAHDDIYLCDLFWPERVREALERFDVVGLAGNRRRRARQPSWIFTDEKFTRETSEHLSGTIGHGHGFPCSNVSFYGPSGQECKLLDGVMLMVQSKTLEAHQLRFDTRFAFHFYDVDFCRQVEAKGLRMGTWPIAVVHESKGAFGTEAWKRGYGLYLEKYQS
jgi:GT2 family glycosyltransferase